jgi:hypothetical protein
MDFAREAERLLKSEDPIKIQKGLGFALLALSEEFRRQQGKTGSLNSRKPEHGDSKNLYCRDCFKETEHVFGGVEQFRWWSCTRCDGRIDC